MQATIKTIMLVLGILLTVIFGLTTVAIAFIELTILVGILLASGIFTAIGILLIVLAIYLHIGK